MLSDSTNKVGGETALRPGDRRILRIQVPAEGSGSPRPLYSP